MIEYYSNNSGGVWWLTDEDWKKLEAAGWIVQWSEEKFLGASATTAHRLGLSREEAIEEWETVLEMRAREEGCSCCGVPHRFRGV